MSTREEKDSTLYVNMQLVQLCPRGKERQYNVCEHAAGTAMTTREGKAVH